MRPGYKQTEVGVIPADWEAVPLGKVSCLHNGYGFSSSSYFSSGRWKIITIANVQSGHLDTSDCNCITAPPKDLQSHHYIRPGDILISMTGNVGRVCQAWESNCLLNQRVGKLVPSGVVDEYFFHCINRTSFRDSMTLKATGGAQGNIGKNDITSHCIPLPPTKAEQEVIAEALSDADTHIAALERLIAKKRQIKQGAMQELLTGKRRLPGFAASTRCKQTEVGVIPADWHVERLRERLVHNATYGIVKAGKFLPSGVPMLRGGDIKGGVIQGDLPFVSEEKSREYSRTILRQFDVVISLVGYPGESAVVPKSLEGSNISRAVGLLRTDGGLLPEYLTCYLNSAAGRREFLKPGAGSAQLVVNLKSLNDMPVPLPPAKAEQEAIADVLSRIEEEALVLEDKLQKSRSIKQALMQELLTGRTRLI